MLPNAFIVGAPKCGTTTIYDYLGRHPDVLVSRIKEPNFFSHEDILAQNLYYRAPVITSRQKYEELFAGRSGARIACEASVSYLFYPSVPRKIHAMLPHAKIIIALRDPVERAFSHYLMDRRMGYVDIPFDAVVSGRGGHPLQELYYQQYVLLGMYHDQVRRYLDAFGAPQILIILQDDLAADKAAVFRRLCGFLGIRYFEDDAKRDRRNAYAEPRNALARRLILSPALKRIAAAVIPGAMRSAVRSLVYDRPPKPELDPHTRDHLYRLYERDIALTSALIGRSLNWRS